MRANARIHADQEESRPWRVPAKADAALGGAVGASPLALVAELDSSALSSMIVAVGDHAARPAALSLFAHMGEASQRCFGVPDSLQSSDARADAMASAACVQIWPQVLPMIAIKQGQRGAPWWRHCALIQHKVRLLRPSLER